MQRRRFALGLALLAACPLWAQQKQGPPGGGPRGGSSPDFSRYARAEVRGTITRVQMSPAMGIPPSLFVRTAGGSETVVLGSMRYLIEQDFNPKAGEPVVARVIRAGDMTIAIEVTLPKQKKTVRLRDEDGLPLWRMRYRPEPDSK